MGPVRAALQGTLRQDGRWAITLDLTKRDGTKQRKTFYARTQREVQAKAHAHLALQGRTGHDPHKLKDAWELWEQQEWPTYKGGLESGAVRQYRWAKTAVIAEFGETKVRSVSGPAIARWLDRLRDDPRLTANSVKHLRSTLSVLMRFCVKIEWAESNPVIGIRLSKLTRRTAVPRRLPPWEWLAVVAEETDGVLRDLWETLGETGFRPDEALRLTDRSIVYRLDLYWLRGGGKTQAGEDREVPIPDELAARLGAREGPLFPGYENGRKGYFLMVNAWRRAVRRAGVEYTRPYEMRKMAISRWIANGLDDDVVKALAGHTDIRITKNVYNRLGRDRIAASVWAPRGPRATVADQLGMPGKEE